MVEICKSIDEAIGGTKIVCLSRVAAEYSIEGNILAKLEFLNPGLSKKDRVAKAMIDEAEKAGLLKRGQTVVELTSGNTGIGLALVCAVRGYKFVACMSAGNSPERARMMRALGAEVVLVPQVEGSVKGRVSGRDLLLVEEEAERITRERGAFRADQFRLPANINAHHYGTAREIIEQTGGGIDAFVDFAGSGGSFAGCAKGLKEFNPDIKCYLVEPEAGAYYFGNDYAIKQEAEMLHNNKETTSISETGLRDIDKETERKGHVIQGGGYSKELSLIDRRHIDGVIAVSDEEAIEYTRSLARLEGAFCGYSSGANICAAIRLLRGGLKGRNIVILLNDTGLKYLSADLYPS
jgi:cysteine synthase A